MRARLWCPIPGVSPATMVAMDWSEPVVRWHGDAVGKVVAVESKDGGLVIEVDLHVAPVALEAGELYGLTVKPGAINVGTGGET